MPWSWKAILGAGALIVFGYAASINSFPDLDLGTSAALFAAVALFGALVLTLCGVTCIAPAYVWLQAVGMSGAPGRALLGSSGPSSATVALQWRAFLAFMAVFAVLTVFGRWGLIVERVTWCFGLGGMQHTGLVLDKSGCAIARAVGVLEGSSGDAETCRLDDVTIDLRLGTTYIVHAPCARADAARRRFSIPRDHVLSPIWPPDPRPDGK